MWPWAGWSHSCGMGAGEMVARKVLCVGLLVLQSRCWCGILCRGCCWVSADRSGASCFPPSRGQMLPQHFMSGNKALPPPGVRQRECSLCILSHDCVILKVSGLELGAHSDLHRTGAEQGSYNPCFHIAPGPTCSLCRVPGDTCLWHVNCFNQTKQDHFMFMLVCLLCRKLLGTEGPRQHLIMGYFLHKTW